MKSAYTVNPTSAAQTGLAWSWANCLVMAGSGRAVRNHNFIFDLEPINHYREPGAS